MKRFIQSAIVFATVCAGWNAVQAQKKETVPLQPQPLPISTSAFSDVLVVDTRLDTFMGYVRPGGLTPVRFIKTALPLKDELTSLVNKWITRANKQDATLCINIRQFAVSEFMGQDGETGVFRISWFAH